MASRPVGPGNEGGLGLVIPDHGLESLPFRLRHVGRVRHDERERFRPGRGATRRTTPPCAIRTRRGSLRMVSRQRDEILLEDVECVTRDVGGPHLERSRRCGPGPGRDFELGRQ